MQILPRTFLSIVMAHLRCENAPKVLKKWPGMMVVFVPCNIRIITCFNEAQVEGLLPNILCDPIGFGQLMYSEVAFWQPIRTSQKSSENNLYIERALVISNHMVCQLFHNFLAHRYRTNFGDATSYSVLGLLVSVVTVYIILVIYIMHHILHHFLLQGDLHPFLQCRTPLQAGMTYLQTLLKASRSEHLPLCKIRFPPNLSELLPDPFG